MAFLPGLAGVWVRMMTHFEDLGFAGSSLTKKPAPRAALNKNPFKQTFKLDSKVLIFYDQKQHRFEREGRRELGRGWR